MKYEDIVRHEEILEYYARGTAILDALGYTDHSTVHTKLVAAKAAAIRQRMKATGDRSLRQQKTTGDLSPVVLAAGGTCPR